MAEPIRFDFRFETRASVARTFKVLSDTDAFNRLAKTGMTFTTEIGADGVAHAIGTVGKLGMTIRWEELPFGFRSPSWFRVRRVFQSGPIKQLVARARVAPTPSGNTEIGYQLEVIPASAIFRPIVSFDLKRTLEPSLRAALSAIVHHLDNEAEQEGPETAHMGAPPALKPKEQARMAEVAARLTATPLRDRLLAFIRGAPERDQQMMSPIALAQAWSAPLEDVAVLFVAAAKVGLLGVRVDLLCPSCAVPKGALDATGHMPEVHCEACGIRLDASYPEGLAIHFFPAPDIRPLKLKIECLGSPARTPQVLAQDHVGPGATVDLVTPLEPGTYQVRTLPQIGPPALLDVRENGTQAEIELTLQASVQPQLARLRPDPTSIRFHNQTERSVVALLEKLEPPRRVLSLGRMIVEYPILKEIVPWSGFVSSMSTWTGYALALRAQSELEAQRLAKSWTAARVAYASGWYVLATYTDPARLLDDLSRCDVRSLLAGISRGTICEATVFGRTTPMGPAVDKAYAAMCVDRLGAIAVPAPETVDAALREALAQAGYAAAPISDRTGHVFYGRAG